jgi:phosphopantothenoylcysteine synthetase/decarboxylase
MAGVLLWVRHTAQAVREVLVTAETRPVLYVIACGAYPAGQLPALVSFAQRQGWDVCVIATPDGAKFLDAGHLAGQTRHPVRSQYKHPDEPDVLPPADAFAIAPATFNTINKLAQGISDTLALGLLNEGIGLGLPIVAVPWPNAALAGHPVFQRSVAVLREWGITVILDPARLPGAGEEPAVFPWEELRAELTNLRAELAEPARE